MECYFPATLARSSYPLSAARIANLEAMLLPGHHYVSPVSKQVITRFSEKQLLGAVFAGLIALGLLSWALVNKTKNPASKT